MSHLDSPASSACVYPSTPVCYLCVTYPYLLALPVFLLLYLLLEFPALPLSEFLGVIQISLHLLHLKIYNTTTKWTTFGLQFEQY